MFVLLDAEEEEEGNNKMLVSFFIAREKKLDKRDLERRFSSFLIPHTCDVGERVGWGGE